jgi:hypothetical protein
MAATMNQTDSENRIIIPEKQLLDSCRVLFGKEI